MNIKSFSDEQMAGQRLMVGFDGSSLTSDLKFFIDTLKVGGIILFTRNLSTPDQIKNLCVSVQAYARSCGQPPLFIAIDQEGGQVARLGEPFTQFPGNPYMKGPEDAIHFAGVTATELSEVGINMNLAPVLDVAPEGEKSVMEKRAFGHDPIRVSELGITVIDHLQKGNIMAVAKHFPGIGRTTRDSHLELPTLDIDLETMTATDLVPFQAAIAHEVAGIMISHILFREIDADWPASLSPKVAEGLLRKRMGYNGVMMTDDLDMGAINKHHDIRTVIGRVLLSDIDIALICHQGPDIKNAFKEILIARQSSAALSKKGAESVRRILKLKKEYIRTDR